jgi:hypothetical protein
LLQPASMRPSPRAIANRRLSRIGWFPLSWGDFFRYRPELTHWGKR